MPEYSSTSVNYPSGGRQLFFMSSSQNNKTQPPRIGLIGVAGYAEIYVDLLQRAHDQKLVDITAVNARPARQGLPSVADLKQRGATIYDSFEDLIEGTRGKMDICLIPTGIQWHTRMAVDAMESGAHVLLEKPLAGSVEDGDAIIRSEEKTGRWLAVGFQDVYSPEALWLREQIQSGVIGKLKSVKMVGLWPRPASYYSRNQWAGKMEADGAAVRDSPLNNAFAHFVNLALFFSGPDADSSADVEVYESELLRARDIETFDTAVVKARSAEGVDFWFGVSHACTVQRNPEIVLEGENGRAEWFHEQHIRIVPNNGEEIRREVPTYEQTRQAMFDAVLNRYNDPKTFIYTSKMAMSQTRFIENVHATGTIVDVPASAIDQPNPEDPQQKQIPAIRGLAESMDQAFKTRSSLKQAGLLQSL